MLTDHRPDITVTGAPLSAAFAAADAGIPLGRPENTLIQVPLDRIVPSRWQPRQFFDPAGLLELANDIATHGILTPPIVWQNEDMEWELIAGERRIRACYALVLCRAGTQPLHHWSAKLAQDGFMAYRAAIPSALPKAVKINHTTIAAIPCRQVYGRPDQLHELALVDNLQRADLTALEEAQAIHDLIEEYHYTQRQLADRLGKSQTWISQRLALLNLAPAVAAQVAGGEVDPATARAVARLEPAVQPAVIAHLQKFGIKSKPAANLVEKLITLADPATHDRLPPAEINPAERRLAQAGLDALDAAGRQTGILTLAASDAKGALPALDDKRPYRDIIAATGLAGPGATRYNVNVADLWPAQAPTIGATCATCQLDPVRGLIAALNQDARRESYASDARWPRCAPGVTTCQAHTPAGAPIRLPLGYGNIASKHVTAAEQPAVTIEPSTWAHVKDPVAWAAILRRKYAAEAAADTARTERKANGIAAALTAYITAQQADDFEPAHFWSQPCVNCVFHKIGADDPAHACQYQAQPPTYDSYTSLIVARLWRSGNAPAIGRCRLFRLKQPSSRLPTLPGAGLDLPIAGMLHTLEQLAAAAYNSNGKRAPAWLDVKRSDPWESPAWTIAEPVLRTLLSDLNPGQRLALLLLWVDPFGYHPFMTRTNDATAYVPRAGRPLTYTHIKDFTV